MYSEGEDVTHFHCLFGYNYKLWYPSSQELQQSIANNL